MSLLDRLFGRQAPPQGSGAVARERLKLVLEYDRAQISAAQLDEIKGEIIDSISRHVAIQREDVKITLEHDGRLVAEIPLDSARTLRPGAAGRAGEPGSGSATSGMSR
jgi:cell division topological specificity factor MinE